MVVPETDSVAVPQRPEGLLEPRYELLPFRRAADQVEQLAEPHRLTVTTSPKHGVDHSLEFAAGLRERGHAVTLHLAARMVRGEQHLEEILERASAAGIDDLFVIGGDAPEPLGPFDAAAPVLELAASHPLRPARLGIGAYPEGHPWIDQASLDAVLEQKSGFADYMVTQLCFDPDALLRWLEGVRARGIRLPLYVGAVGPVERRRLLEISTQIGVGTSLRFLRKQRGLTSLFRGPFAAASSFYDAVAPHVGDPALELAGFHLFTFNDLLGTKSWRESRSERAQ